MSLPQVALVGRPNVGKSTLFNRLIGMRRAVVADVAGTTRDRLYHPLQWKGQAFELGDMAGLELTFGQQEVLHTAMQEQVEKALESAAVLIWVVDAQTGVTQQDEQIARLLRQLNKPVIVAVNKCDHPQHEIMQYEFARFGFEPIIPISAMHARQSENLLDAVAVALPAENFTEETPVIEVEQRDPKELSLVIAGRPNVGKSTLLNGLLGEERAVVSDIAGTTRDSVDSVIPSENLFGRTFTKWERVRLVDTAGIRQRGKIGHEVEAWSVLRTLDALDRAEVVLFLIDATTGLVHQDLQVLQRVVEAGRAAALVLNKWDSVCEAKKIIIGTDEEQKLQEQFLSEMRLKAPFLHWMQVIFLSAKTKLNHQALGKVVLAAYIAWDKRIKQEELDELTILLQRTPRLANLQRIEFKHSQPPVFHIHVEGRKLPHFSTNRLIENALREYLDIGPTPIKIWSVPSVAKRKKF